MVIVMTVKKTVTKKPAPKNPAMNWPTQAQCDKFYGNPRVRRAAWEKTNLVNFVPPWQMIDEDSKKPIKSFKIHRKCADSLKLVFDAIWHYYDQDQDKIEHVNLHVFSGSYVFRNIRGVRSLSMHAYGCALDIASALNEMGHKHDPVHGMPHEAIVEFQAEGWTWGGMWSRPDAMHFQAARVR